MSVIRKKKTQEESNWYLFLYNQECQDILNTIILFLQDLSKWQHQDSLAAP